MNQNGPLPTFESYLSSVNEAKKLPVLYHGTRDSSFTEFDDDYEGDGSASFDFELPEGVIFLTTSREEAASYGHHVFEVELKPNSVLTIEISSDKPSQEFDRDWQTTGKMWDKFTNGRKIYAALEVKGYSKSTVVTYANNVKSIKKIS